MDAWELEGREFTVVMASDVIRDGMGLELTARLVRERPVLEAFWHDDGSSFHFIIHKAGTLQFSVIEGFVAQARKVLPPTNET